MYDGKITKVKKNSEQNNSETVTNEHDKEIPKERYVSPQERQKIIAELRLRLRLSIIMEYQKITKVSKSSEKVTNESDEEIPQERYISPKERQKRSDDFRLK